MDTLDHLPLLEPEAKPVTDLAEIAEYNKIEAAFNELEQRATHTVFDLSTNDGLKMAHQTRTLCETLRTSLDRARLASNKEDNARIKARNEKAKALTERIYAIETPLYDKIKAVQAAKAAEIESKRVAEETRVNNLKARLAHINGYAAAIYKTSAEAKQAIQRLTDIVVGDDWQEMAKDATQAREDAIALLSGVMSDLIDKEAEALRLATLAKELKAKEDKIEADRIAAEATAKADDERKAAIQKRIGLIRRAAKAAPGTTSEALVTQIAAVYRIVIDESFGEFQQAAEDELSNTKDCLQSAYDSALASEQAAAKLKKEQDEFAETQRLAKEKAEKEKADRLADDLRKDRIRARVDNIQLIGRIQPNSPSEILIAEKRKAEAIPVGEDFQEFQQEAVETKANVLIALDQFIKFAILRDEQAAKEQAEATRKQQQADFEREQFAIVEKQDREADEIHESDIPADRFAGRYTYDIIEGTVRGPGYVAESKYLLNVEIIAELNRLDVANQELLEAVNDIAKHSAFTESDAFYESIDYCKALARKYAPKDVS